MRVDGGVRGARAVLYSGLCVLLTVSGHVVMSGSPVPPWSLMVPWAALAAVLWCVGGRERGPVAVVGGAFVVQLLLHSFFTAVQHCHHPPPGALSEPPGALRSDLGAGHAGHMAPHHGDMGLSGLSLLGSSLGMATGHAAVALLSAVWLWRGERAVFRLLRWAVLRLLHLAPPVNCSVIPGRDPSAPVYWARDDRALPRLLLIHSLASRGPPAPSAVPSTAQRHRRVPTTL